MTETTKPTPTLVTVYDMGTGELRRTAEFRLIEGHAELTVIDPNGCGLAQRLHTHGVELLDEPRRVPPEEGPAFMRALLQPFRMSYYRIVDESPGTAGKTIDQHDDRTPHEPDE
ncbi:hypothetical protein [Nocardia sp. NPDC004750]